MVSFGVLPSRSSGVACSKVAKAACRTSTPVASWRPTSKLDSFSRNKHSLSLPVYAAAGRRPSAGGSSNENSNSKEQSLGAETTPTAGGGANKSQAAGEVKKGTTTTAGTIADLEAQLASKVAELDEVKTELAGLRLEVDTRTAAVAELQAKLAASTADVDRLTSELEVARSEASAASKLQSEIDTRTAAMANLQAQLEAVENLRAEELKSAIARFEELENTLTLAEHSMDLEGKRVESLESKVARLENDLEAASYAAEELRGELHGAQRAEKEAADAAHAAQKDASAARQLAIDEAVRSGEVLTKAEALAAAVAERLGVLAQAESEEEEEEEEYDTTTLSEADAEALLDELDLLRGELEAELQATEDEALRADAAEADAAALRQQLAALASAGDDGTDAMGGFSQSLVQELAAARAAAARAAAEAEALRVTVTGLETQLKTYQEQKAVPKTTLGFGNASNALSEAMEKIKQLESEATKRDASLAEGRAFLATILEQQRQQLKDKTSKQDAGRVKEVAT